jgi:hypothetical protein
MDAIPASALEKVAMSALAGASDIAQPTVVVEPAAPPVLDEPPEPTEPPLELLPPEPFEPPLAVEPPVLDEPPEPFDPPVPLEPLLLEQPTETSPRPMSPTNANFLKSVMFNLR